VHTRCREESRKLAAHWRNLPRDTRSDILWAAVRADATGALFDRPMADVLREKDRQTREDLYGALAGTTASHGSPHPSPSQRESR
jgi:hypothetical protein